MSPPPATPPIDRERSTLWSSPQFSDYFSDTGDSTATSADQRKVHTPAQVRIIDRLGAIARKVAEQDHDGAQTPQLTDLDSELSALESRINAPDSQTRQIAEETGTLFLDDDDPAVLQAENKDLRRALQEGRDVIVRVSRLRESLQNHYDEMKDNYQLTAQRLQSASDQISTLQDENESLRAENEKLRDQNAHIHNDLQTAIPTISRLRARLDNIERRSLETVEPEAIGDRLEESISSLTREFDDVERDFEDMARRYRKKSSGRVDSAIGNGTPTPPRDTRSASPETGHRSMIIIRRGGLIRRIDADASSSEESDDAIDEQRDGHEVEKLTDLAQPEERDEEETQQKKGENVEQPQPVGKTPWEELWESIAEFAGMHNHYDD